ncbi:PPOX class F420-dependent oxidoreductase [Agrococcus sp. SGAir0287]|uniref:PPOX class F420-dependent oxidoreductase n=1 Tax=Agrococcus sp. SGAir0287 TaxID=2070347 RepID=UPI0010CD0E31|nr:PPOX class F420-dependent oxidoreductase [Agrococcus sp. SGAir0287]QCR20615.1 PPOX class F420-dependent oxidoreductase [Agrococcus sp. SGAir0287]
MGAPLNPSLPASHEDLLVDAHYAHMATVRPDGAPQSSVMWFDWDGRALRITHTRSRQKLRNLEHEGRVSFSIHDPASPLRALEVRGRVVDVADDDADASFYKRLQHRYGMDYPVDDADERVVITIAPTKFIAVGGGQIVASNRVR